MQFPCLPVGVKWKVVKNPLSPSLDWHWSHVYRPFNLKSYYKNTAQWAIAKNKENVHFPHGPLLKALQRASSPGLMRIETACVG